MCKKLFKKFMYVKMIGSRSSSITYQNITIRLKQKRKRLIYKGVSIR